MMNVEGNESLKIVPPWRKETASGMKIKAFLRGQKIPLHCRGATPILCIKIDDVMHIAAVFVDYQETNKLSRWIINGILTPHQEADKRELYQVLIKKEDQC